jgi:hypothetical protein
MQKAILKNILVVFNEILKTRHKMQKTLAKNLQI